MTSRGLTEGRVFPSKYGQVLQWNVDWFLVLNKQRWRDFKDGGRKRRKRQQKDK